MIDKINEVLSRFKGSTVEFAMDFEKSEGTLAQQLEKLFYEETKQLVRSEKELFISELENMVLVWNNNVLMSKLQLLRQKLDEEAKQ